ncbi:MAG: hypothetical protein M0Z95_13735 [Actinomycetota bacterium]|nr:hypothetical protein [Actinomycetota bacterium]
MRVSRRTVTDVVPGGGGGTVAMHSVSLGQFVGLGAPSKVATR